MRTIQVSVLSLCLCVPGVPVTRAAEVALPAAGGSIVEYDGNGAACRDATADETLAMRVRDMDALRELSSPARKQSTGMRIILRGTSQLDQFPEARAAFLRAAATWESLISTPVTMIVDVDFGPTRFGTPYPSRVIGSTDPQYNPTVATPFVAAREALIQTASNAAERTLYTSLPGESLPTTDGPALLVYSPVAVLRAIGLEAAEADPTNEEERLGTPPSIGFNSNFEFDFDPTDGIDLGTIDFEGVALHELGHALGFNSWSGIRELTAAPVLLTTWDIFRFRPGVTPETFNTASRVTLSGGEHVYFTGSGGVLGLSTGRPDGSGGDGRQASHWKDNRLTDGVYVGVMDPTLSDGERIVITENDLDALDWMGWRIGRAPSIEAFGAVADEDVVRIDAVVSDDDVVGAEAVSFEVLDREGTALGELVRTGATVTPAGDALHVVATFSGLTAFEAAWLGRLVIRDSSGLEVSSDSVDLDLPDPDGPRVATAFFRRNKKELRLTGTGYAGEVRVTINGVEITPRKIKRNGAATKLRLKGDATLLNVISGENVLRVFVDGKRSNVFRFLN